MAHAGLNWFGRWTGNLVVTLVVRRPGRDPNPIEPPTERRPSHLRERQVRAPPQVPMEAGFTPPTEVILLSCIRI